MEELDLKDLFNIFLEKKLTILTIIVIFAIIGFIYTIWFVTPKYQSSTTLILVQSDSNKTNGGTNSITSTDVTLNTKMIATYNDVITSKSVVRQVISNLGLDIEESTVKNGITVSAGEDDTQVMKITVTNTDATYAYKIANELAKVFSEKVVEIYNVNNVRILDEAEIAQGPYNINHAKDIIIFGFIGLVVAVAYILILNMLDNSVKLPEDIEKNLKVPVLATIPLTNPSRKKGVKK